MRFFGYTLADETIPTPPPSPELFEQMDAFVAEAVAAGVIVATGGIGRPHVCHRAASSNGRLKMNSPCA
jgi:hypothetical protein